MDQSSYSGAKKCAFPLRFNMPVVRRLQRPDSTEALLKQSVFGSLEDRDIRSLCRVARSGKRKRYELLLRAGENNDTLYLITKGACLIRRDKGFFAEIDRGHFIGEMSFFNRQPVSVDVVARGELEYLAWDHQQLQKLFRRRPGLQSRFYAILGTHMANRLASATEKLLAS